MVALTAQKYVGKTLFLSKYVNEQVCTLKIVKHPPLNVVALTAQKYVNDG